MARLPLAASSTAPHELTRDIYGFAVRPHHVQLYKHFAEIYKEEEAERSARWDEFLSAHGKCIDTTHSEDCKATHHLGEGSRAEDCEKKQSEGLRKFKTWCPIRASLQPLEEALRHHSEKSSWKVKVASTIAATEHSSDAGGSQGSEDDSDEEFYDAERVDTLQDGLQILPEIIESDAGFQKEDSCPWKEELDALVRGGIPMALRGEVWQVFVGSSFHRVHGHYQALLTVLTHVGDDDCSLGGACNQNDAIDGSILDTVIPKKWLKQIEKDIPRTFPGHPALDMNGRKALRNILIAYARHNSNVGYCQAMNFFAGLLSLMMPEENAFWTLAGILDDYFEGYYTEKMLEFQVDQLVLEELARLHFPRLMTHLDTLGLQVAWITGPWFLSIFINVLPWESVLRVWDVLLYEQNRSMIFRTTLALLELHGSAVLTAKDAGDAVTLLQSLVSATFDSSQLVLTACVVYQTIRESHLEQLRAKYYPQVLAISSEQSKWHKPYGPFSVPSKILDCNKPIDSDIESSLTRRSGQSLLTQRAGDNGGVEAFLEKNGVYASSIEKDHNEVLEKGTMLSDLINQVSCIKLELSRTLEDRRVANIRAEELETAFMELVKEDNRRLLSAKVENLEAEVAHLRHMLTEKSEQNEAMIQVMVRMEDELKATQEAQVMAEEDAEMQRSALNAIQMKYEHLMASIKELEARAIRAENLLESNSPHHVVKNGTASTRQPSISAAEEPSRWAWSWSTTK